MLWLARLVEAPVYSRRSRVPLDHDRLCPLTLTAIRGSRLARAGCAYGAALSFYLLAIRSRLLRWGASEDEVRREAPGDQAVPAPYTVSTRAVTIRAQPDRIWPWLAQMGTSRGGLCSYDWLDRLFGYISSPSSEEILPQFQNLTVGDVIPLARGPSWPVIVADHDHALVVEPVAGQVSWAWLLNALDADTTRLISRVRMRLGFKPLLLAFAPAIELPWFLMERGMLHGIKRRAEGLAQAGTPARHEHR
jgi:hypothetical protein